MGLTLTKKKVEERLCEYAPEHYLHVFGIVKGVAIAFAAVVFVSIATDPDYWFERLLLWLVSLMAVLVSYITTSGGILLTSHRYNLSDAILPLLIGLTECVLFVLVAPSVFAATSADEPAPPLWLFWIFTLSVQAALAALMVWNRIRQVREEDFDDALLGIVPEMKRWLSKDRIGAGGFAVVLSLAGGLLQLPCFTDRVDPGCFQLFLAVGAGVLIASIMIRANRQRIRIAEYLEGTVRGARARRRDRHRRDRGSTVR